MDPRRAHTLAGMGIFSNLMCTGIPLFNIRLSVCTLLLLVPTAALNVLLVFMIVRKLLQARKSSILINDHTSAVRYVTIMNIVVESALAWVVAIVLELASDNIDGLMQWGQFFDCIFQIVSVSTTRCFARVSSWDLAAAQPGSAAIPHRS
jgi:hypothetical protein